MKTIVQNVNINDKRRILAISDIHGNLKLLKQLLAKVNYTEDDILILIGDLIEKGTQNIETLQYIIELQQQREVYAVQGNCDIRWKELEEASEEIIGLKNIVFRKNTLMSEICQRLQMDRESPNSYKEIIKTARKYYGNLLNWVENLPHIIATEQFIFAHAGISSNDLETQDTNQVLRRDAFIEEGRVFEKYVIVGHWPSANYGKDKGDYNPIINTSQKIISIDGGNGVLSGGQLNALIIEDGKFAYETVDSMPKVSVKKAQKGSEQSIQIMLMDNEIQLIEEGEVFTYCKHVSTQYELWIPNNKIYTDGKNVLRCGDVTDYFVEAGVGDMVSVIERVGNRSLVKKDGILGWIFNENLEE